jgi:hypothetical protein
VRSRSITASLGWSEIADYGLLFTDQGVGVAEFHSLGGAYGAKAKAKSKTKMNLAQGDAPLQIANQYLGSKYTGGGA